MGRISSALTATTVLIVIGCAEAPDSTPTAPAGLTVAQAQCQFGILPDLARRYFPAASVSPVRSLIAQMEALFRAGDLRGATGKGFDLLAQVEAVANTGTGGSPGDGSAFVNAVLACMSVGQPDLPIDFTGALDPGAFAVRGGPPDPTGPVLSRDDFAGIGMAGEATWSRVLGQRALILGTPNPAANFNELLIDDPYEWSTVPSLSQINPGAIMGLCVENTGRFRLERVHGGSSHTLLFLRDPSFFLACPNLVVTSPRPNNPGPVGGSATGFSDFGSVDAISINLSYLSQPSSTPAGAIISPAVRLFAQGSGGTPLPEVTISLSLVTLSGSGALSGTTTKVTATGGVETFIDLRVSAPGTYALLATATLAGYSPVVLQSAGFAVTP